MRANDEGDRQAGQSLLQQDEPNPGQGVLVLTINGLAAGVLVAERRRAELQLRPQQDAQAGLARLGSMGERPAALAHEVSQPLTAAGTCARVVLPLKRTAQS